MITILATILLCFLLGFIVGNTKRGDVTFAYLVKLCGTAGKLIKRQIKIHERQCRLFYILRVRYKDKLAIKWFNKGNK